MALPKKRFPRKAPPKLYVGEWVARLGRKQTDVAEAARITEAYLSEIISGKKKNPSLAVLLAISDALGITINDLRYPPPPIEAIEAARRLDPTQLAALARLLSEMNVPPRK